VAPQSADRSRGALHRDSRHHDFRRLFVAQTVSRWGDTLPNASIVIGGVLADHLGIRGVHITGGAVLLAAGTLGYTRVPRSAMTTPDAGPPT
jgi:hypothetical protein